VRASPNTLSTREVEYLLSGESEFGFVPVLIAAGKAVGKTARNVAVNAQANARGQEVPAEVPAAAPGPIVVPSAPASSAIPFFLASMAGLGLGLLAGYMVGHARST
jgi:hypothetical protein